jgi:hypothetical protein
MHSPDELDDYLRGDSALSRQYRKEPASMPPHGLDRNVLASAGDNRSKSPCLAPLALAASILLSVALVLAIAFGPQSAKRGDDTPRVVRVAARAEVPSSSPLPRKLQLYSSDPRRAPSVWLAEIDALRRAGRNSEADAEMRRFRSVYPDYSTDRLAIRP